jgi:hypothetical protein
MHGWIFPENYIESFRFFLSQSIVSNTTNSTFAIDMTSKRISPKATMHTTLMMKCWCKRFLPETGTWMRDGL